MSRFRREGMVSVVRKAECTTTEGKKYNALKAAARRSGAAIVKPRFSSPYRPNAPTFHANPRTPAEGPCDLRKAAKLAPSRATSRRERPGNEPQQIDD
jgi:hypothetical protein